MSQTGIKARTGEESSGMRFSRVITVATAHLHMLLDKTLCVDYGPEILESKRRFLKGKIGEFALLGSVSMACNSLYLTAKSW
jgi:hypothetical protein